MPRSGEDLLEDEHRLWRLTAPTGEAGSIEFNDGQERGDVGVSPFALWQRILDVERERAG